MITLEVGKTYKTKQGRLVKITKHDPLWHAGVFWATSCDGKKPEIHHERWQPDGRWFSFICSFSQFDYQELRDPGLDLVEQID